MKFKTKIIISFCISIFVPIMLALFIMSAFRRIQGNAFIITILENKVPEFSEMVADIVIAVFVILILTACMLAVWLYASIVNPIRKLQAAAQNIKE